MWVALLGLDRSLSTRNSPWSRLVSLRQPLPNGLRVLLRLLLLLWLGCRSLAWAMNGHSWLGHKVGIGSHLWGHSVAGCRWDRVLWCRGVAGNGGLDAIHSSGRGPDWGRGNRSRLGGLRRGRPVT